MFSLKRTPCRNSSDYSNKRLGEWVFWLLFADAVKLVAPRVASPSTGPVLTAAQPVCTRVRNCVRLDISCLCHLKVCFVLKRCSSSQVRSQVSVRFLRRNKHTVLSNERSVAASFAVRIGSARSRSFSTNQSTSVQRKVQPKFAQLFLWRVTLSWSTVLSAYLTQCQTFIHRTLWASVVLTGTAGLLHVKINQCTLLYLWQVTELYAHAGNTSPKRSWKWTSDASSPWPRLPSTSFLPWSAWTTGANASSASHDAAKWTRPWYSWIFPWSQSARTDFLAPCRKWVWIWSRKRRQQSQCRCGWYETPDRLSTSKTCTCSSPFPFCTHCTRIWWLSQGKSKEAQETHRG